MEVVPGSWRIIRSGHAHPTRSHRQRRRAKNNHCFRLRTNRIQQAIHELGQVGGEEAPLERVSVRTRELHLLSSTFAIFLIGVGRSVIQQKRAALPLDGW